MKEFKSFHEISCRNLTKIFQNELFDIMYFSQDNFYQLKQFHISGKLITKELLLNAIKNIDDYYIS